MPATSNQKKPARRPGEWFQRLIGIVEKSIAGDDTYTVEVSKRLRDRDTGRLREHDVVLTHRQAHHELITSIECRDRSRKIGVPDVEQFQKKCERTGVHRGVMVSPLGFAKTALAKAASLGIECLTMEGAEIFSWCSMQFATVQTPKLISARFIPVPEPPGTTEMMLYARPNILIDRARMTDIAERCIAEWRKDEQRASGNYFINFNLVGSEYYLVDKEGAEYVVESLAARLQFELIDAHSPLKFEKYQTADGQTFAEVATVQLDLGPRKGKLVFVNKPGERTEVLLAFE